MPDNKILIEVKSNLGSSAPTVQDAAKKANPPSSQTITNISKVKAIGAVTMAGKQAFGYSTSNVGKWTGNSHSQQMVNNAMQTVQLGMLAYLNPYVAVVSVGMNVVTTMLNDSFDKKWSNARQSNSRAKAGYNSQNEVVGRRH